MAKTIRSNKSKGIQAVSSKDKFLDKLKILTKYLASQDPKYLPKLINDKDMGKRLRYRSIALLLNHPKIIWYINKYMNNLFLYDSWDNEVWFRTIADICRIYGIDNSKSFRFSKFQTDESANFYKTVKAYYKETGKLKPSHNELNALYELYKVGIITDDALDNMKRMIDGKDNRSKSERAVQQMVQQSFIHTQATKEVVRPEDVERTFDSLSTTVQEFISKVRSYIQGRNACRNCPLYSNGSVILDTNLEEPGPVDILLIGLNPGKDEIKAGVPFVGKSGKVLKRYLLPLINNNGLTYMITNCILCYTNNESDIPNPMSVSNNCKDLVTEILRYFPAKVTVLLGDKAMKSMGVKGGISKQTGTVVNGYFILLHPSAVLYNPKLNLPRFEKSMRELERLITGSVSDNLTQQPVVNMNVDKINIPEEKIITRFSQDLSLFDIQIINEQIIYIMKDPKGVKKYLVEQIQFPVYFKSGNYKDCHFVENAQMEAVTYLSAAEKQKLASKLYHNVKSLTG